MAVRRVGAPGVRDAARLLDSAPVDDLNGQRGGERRGRYSRSGGASDRSDRPQATRWFPYTLDRDGF
jgi:hypothetical protein